MKKTEAKITNIAIKAYSPIVGSLLFFVVTSAILIKGRREYQAELQSQAPF